MDKAEKGLLKRYLKQGELAARDALFAELRAAA